MWSAELQALNTISLGAEKTRETRRGAARTLRFVSSILFIALVLAVQGFEIFAQPVEAALPLEALFCDPSLGFGERSRIDAASAHASRLLRNDQPRALQHGEMLHHRRQRHDERALELADRSRSLGEPLDHRSTARIGESLERPLERRFIVKHMPKYHRSNT